MLTLELRVFFFNLKSKAIAQMTLKKFKYVSVFGHFGYIENIHDEYLCMGTGVYNGMLVTTLR